MGIFNALNEEPKQQPILQPLKEPEQQQTNIPLIASGGQEKQDEPKGLWKVLDLLQRPNYAIAGGVKAALEGENVLKEAYEGFTGKERETFSDVLGLYWEPETKQGKITKGIAGFALDVLLDPTTYIGIGALTKTGKVAQKGGKLAATISKQAKVGERALVQFMGKTIVKGEKVFAQTDHILDLARATNVGEKLGKAFIPNFRPSGVNPEVWKTFSKIKTAAENVRQYKLTKAMDLAVKSQILTNDVVTKHGEDTLMRVLTAIEKPLQKVKDVARFTDAEENLAILLDVKPTKYVVDTLPEEAKELVKISRGYLDELEKVRELANKKTLSAEDMKYLPHVHKEDYINDLKRIFGKSKVYSTDTPSDITRQVFKFVDEAGNELGIGRPEAFGLKVTKEGKYVSVARKKAKNLPPEVTGVYDAVLPTVEEKIKAGYDLETKIGTLLGVAGARGAKLEAANVFFDQITSLSVNKGGLDTATSIADAIPIKGIPELRGYKFNPEIAKEIKMVHEKLSNKEIINDFVKLYDNVQNAWKGTATFVNPAFHSRNAISNMYNNMLAGVKNPKQYAKAAAIQAFVNGDEVSMDTLKFIDKSFGKINAVDFKIKMNKMIGKYYDDFNKMGLRGTTFFGSDIEKSISRQLEPTLLGSKTLGKGVAVGKKAGIAVEENARLAHFIDKIDKGFTPEAAAESVKKFLFDYEDLTDFERNVLKRVVPFYTWTRKNIPLQLEMLANKPRYALGVKKAATNIEKAADTDRVNKKYLPEWMQKSAPIVIGKDGDKIKVMRLEGYLPVADVAKLDPTEVGKQIVNMTSPLIKLFPELVLNTNTFFEKKIQEFPGERKDILRVKVNPYLDHILRQIRPVNELDKLIGSSQDKVSKNAKTINLLFGGKIYHIDLAKQRRIEKYLKSQKVRLLKNKARYNYRMGDYKEGKRLLEEIKKL